MGGFLGIGGSQGKTNRKFELGGAGDLNNLFNFALPAAESTFSAGSSALGDTAAYWKKILTGNRATLEQAAAPETNATLRSADAARKQQATMGTARGGGVAGTNQAEQDTTRATIDNALFGARGSAAKGLEGVGSAQMSDALNALGLGGSVASQLFVGPGSSTNTGDPAGQGAAAANLISSIVGLFG